MINDQWTTTLRRKTRNRSRHWIGEVEWIRDVSKSLVSHWPPDIPGYSSYLSIRLFGLEENSDYGLAEKCGRQAVDLDPTGAWGAHAIAHVLIMQGRPGYLVFD